MRVRARILIGVLAALLATGTSWSLLADNAAAISGTITLTITCATSPERTTIVNKTDETLDLSRFTLLSTFEPLANVEPLRLTGSLAPNRTEVFETGPGASTNVLTAQEIYSDAASNNDGALLSTPFGILIVPCAVGSGVREVTSGTSTPVPGGATPTTGPATPTTGAVPQQCFPETGQCIRGIFLTYWLANGGLRQQGYPLTAEADEVNPTDGRIYRTQYFERARFEYHPEAAGTPFEVLLGLLGREQFLARYPGGRPAGGTPAGSDVCFDVTRRCIRGIFFDYWVRNGGLAQQGYPISDEFEEVSPTNGQTYRVQYFERARFEYHPENAGTENEVLLGLLGREQLLARSNPGTQPGPGATPTPNATPTRAGTPATTTSPTATGTRAGTPGTPTPRR